MINLTLQVKKLRGKEVKNLVWGHTMNQWQSLDLNPNLTDSKTLFFLLHSTGGLQPGFKWSPTSELRGTIVYKFVCIFNGESISFIGFPKVVATHSRCLYHAASLEVVAFELGLEVWAGLHETGWRGKQWGGDVKKANWVEGRAHVGAC